MDKSVRKLVADGIKNMLCGRIEAARTALDNPQAVDDEAVHAARKHLKGARAGLRLLRHVVGERRYSMENARLRDAARPLSRVRDAKVLIETVEQLVTDEAHADERKLLARLLQALRREHKLLRSKLPGETLQSTLSALAEAERNVARWRLDVSDDELASDAQRMYRKSRKAMRLARDECSDGALHEARKQAKYLAHALETLEVVGARHAAKSIKRAKAIGDQLGWDHDLALIQAKLITPPERPQRATEKLSAELQGRRTKLQRRAFRNGRRLHEQKAGAFVRSLAV